MPTRSERLEKLPPYVFSVIGDRLRELDRQGADVIRLDIGNPDMPPPNAVIEALYASAKQPENHGYSGYRGTPIFREAVADYYNERFGVSINPDKELLPLIGSKEGIINLCLAYLGPGDIALVPDVGYPSYSMGARLAGGEIYWVPIKEENGFLPDLASIPQDVLRRAKLLWINYPNNPTGAFADVAFYEQAAAFCLEHDLLLISDNPYVDITFDNIEAPSALQTTHGTQNVIELLSFSKSYNMAGWRLGAAIGSPDAIDNLLRVKSNVDSGHFKAVYDAGAEALKTPQSWIQQRNTIYQLRRDRIMAVLPEIGLNAKLPAGSLYVWARVENGNSTTYVERALTEAHVSFAPGGAYGPGGDGYIRISVGVTDVRLDEALERLKSWYAKV